MTDWWLPSEIRFTREQCHWVIAEVFPLEDGKWPNNPMGTGYTDEPLGNKSVSHHASFETPCQVTGELWVRLESTKEAGEALIDEVLSGINDYEFLSRPAKRALNYISGWRRRKQTYSEWKKYNRKFDQIGEYLH